MNSAGQKHAQTDDPAFDVHPVPSAGSMPVCEGELSPAAYEMVRRSLGEAGARRLQRYMFQNVQYDENSFLCLDLLLDTVVLEAAARIPLQIAAGIAEMRASFAEDTRQRQAACDEFLQKLGPARLPLEKRSPKPRPHETPSPTAKFSPWLRSLPQETRFRRLRAVCGANLAQNKKVLVAFFLLAALGIWTNIYFLEYERAQQWQEQESELVNGWQRQRIARLTIWYNQQTELFAQERTQLLADVQRQFAEHNPQQPKSPVAVPAEPAIGTRNSSKRNPR